MSRHRAVRDLAKSRDYEDEDDEDDYDDFGTSPASPSGIAVLFVFKCISHWFFFFFAL